MNHLNDLTDLKKENWENIVNLAIKICNNPSDYSHICDGKVLATLFYEPSTRTQMSFQTAMLRLGGNIIGFDNPQNSSVSKGENLADTIRIISGYADAIAMRHSIEGATLAAGQYTDCILINAGDGGHFHPTQTLTDLVTIKKEIGHFDNLTIGLCGDLKNGRTVHSLINLLSRYDSIKFILISTDELKLPDRFKHIINDGNCSYSEVLSIEEAISELDVLYMTRIQKERFASEELYNQQKNVYILDCAKLVNAKSDLKILHPLPRIDEIASEVDNDERACYFKQAKYGVYARMALIMSFMLQSDKQMTTLNGEDLNQCCKNENCITNHENYLKNSFLDVGGQLYCEYCDNPQ
ncbi:MAG: aspartate carbamoyltransferase [Oscillospiraceae bacterium]